MAPTLDGLSSPAAAASARTRAVIPWRSSVEVATRSERTFKAAARVRIPLGSLLTLTTFCELAGPRESQPFGRFRDVGGPSPGYRGSSLQSRRWISNDSATRPER